MYFTDLMPLAYWSIAMGANDNLARGERLQIMLAPDELALVDDFRFKKRMPSRAAAVRELFRLGLSMAKSSPAEAGQKSADFGVIAKSNDGIGGPR
jgi:hypothetical protein